MNLLHTWYRITTTSTYRVFILSFSIYAITTEIVQNGKENGCTRHLYLQAHAVCSRYLTLYASRISKVYQHHDMARYRTRMSDSSHYENLQAYEKSTWIYRNNTRKLSSSEIIGSSDVWSMNGVTKYGTVSLSTILSYTSYDTTMGIGSLWWWMDA